jgi:hypothetical protein
MLPCRRRYCFNGAIVIVIIVISILTCENTMVAMVLVTDLLAVAVTDLLAVLAVTALLVVVVLVVC